MSSTKESYYPASDSSSLALRHPTPEERIEISTNTSQAWKDSLTLSMYLEESLFMATVPLSQNDGMTVWILVDKDLPPNHRPVLCSCESFRKRSLTSDAEGIVKENIVHGIASVFSPLQYRRRGYTGRMMRELSKTLSTWQTDVSPCIGSVLYSDIGKEFYTKLGWNPNITNNHVVLPPLCNTVRSTSVQDISTEYLHHLCERDEDLVRKNMATPTNDPRTRMTIIPDADHMLWHISKEEFACKYLFHKTPTVKGAIAGSPGNRVWIVWTHRYYSHPDVEVKELENVLYILRLVIENEQSTAESVLPHQEQDAALCAVLEAAQVEAAEWKLDVVKLWDPSPSVHNVIELNIAGCTFVEREEDSIASGLWFDEKGGAVEIAPIWLNNEHYAWC